MTTRVELHERGIVDEYEWRIPMFGGGIGDVFLACCTTDRYRFLESTTKPVMVVSACRNQYIHELFDWHPRGTEIRLLHAEQIGAANQWKKLFLQERGLDIDRAFEGRNELNWNTHFFPAPRDAALLESAASTSYGIFAPFSKPCKTVPIELQDRLVLTIGERLLSGTVLYGIGRGYDRINLQQQSLKSFRDKHAFRDLTSANVSVPGSFELARMARFYVGANSCLALVTMSLGIPTVILEHAGHNNPRFWPRLFDLESRTLIQKFASCDIELICDFLASKTEVLS